MIDHVRLLDDPQFGLPYVPLPVVTFDSSIRAALASEVFAEVARLFMEARPDVFVECSLSKFGLKVSWYQTFDMGPPKPVVFEDVDELDGVVSSFRSRSVNWGGVSVEGREYHMTAQSVVDLCDPNPEQDRLLEMILARLQGRVWE